MTTAVRQLRRARNLAVPDLTTAVLTMTLTGIAADLRRRDVRVALRRTIAVLAMLAGALVGAAIASRTPRDWQTP
jgi:uncharacterized membrane protein YfcA